MNQPIAASASIDLDKLKPSHCHKCGLPLVDNPHPEAGKPSHYLEVGCQKECLPCTVRSRHQWASRAMKAEGQLANLARRATSTSGADERACFGTWFNGYKGLHPATDTNNRSDAFDLWKAWQAALTHRATTATPVAWRDALRRAGYKDHHGLIAFTPAQLERFVSELTGRATTAEQQAAPEKHVATYSGIEFSRYTIEWTDGPVPVGTKLYTTTASAPAPSREAAGQLDLPEMESLADLEYAQSTPEGWDDDYRNTWQKLQVAERNKMQWRTYALQLRAALAQQSAAPGAVAAVIDVEDGQMVGIKVTGDRVPTGRYELRAAQAQAGGSDARDAARYRFIEEHATMHGGGHGFTITCFVGADEEDMGVGIDKMIAAITAAGQEGGGK